MKAIVFFLLVSLLVQKVVVSNDDGTEPSSNVPSPTAVSPKPPKPPSNGEGSSGGGGSGGSNGVDDDFWGWHYGLPSPEPTQTPNRGGNGGSSGGNGGTGSGSGGGSSGSGGQDAIVGTSSFSFTYYMANTTMDCWGSTDSLALSDAAVVKAAALLLTNVDNRCFATVQTVIFTTMKSSSSSIVSSAMNMAVQNIVVATTISGQANSSTEATTAMARLTKAINSNALQSDLRYYSRTAQPHARLDNVVVCHKAANNLAQCIQSQENNGGGLNGGGSNGNGPIEGQVTTTPGCTFDSNNWNAIYRRTRMFILHPLIRSLSHSRGLATMTFVG